MANQTPTFFLFRVVFVILNNVRETTDMRAHLEVVLQVVLGSFCILVNCGDQIMLVYGFCRVVPM